jgi:hypothetical protein
MRGVYPVRAGQAQRRHTLRWTQRARFRQAGRVMPSGPVKPQTYPPGWGKLFWGLSDVPRLATSKKLAWP